MRRRFVFLPLTFLLLAGGLAAEEAKITLGPWLYYTDPETAVLQWRTNIPVPSEVTCSLADTLTSNKKVAANTEHRMMLTSLPRHTQGEYKIGVPDTEGAVQWQTYELDTSFNYTTPNIPDGMDPYPGERFEIFKRDTDSKAWSHSGYCIVLACGEGALAWQIASMTPELQVIGVDTDGEAITRGREKLMGTGFYGSRITLQTVESLESLPFSDNFANVVMVNRAMTPAIERESKRIMQAGHRGVIGLREAENHRVFHPANLVKQSASGRQGSWTHQYASPDNAARSNESLGGAAGTTDLQVQWLGRPGPRAMVDRNPRTPSPLYIADTLYTQGFQRIIAQDVYNGTIRWTLELPGFMRYNIPRDCSNWCAKESGVYLAHQGYAWDISQLDGHIKRIYPVIKDRADRDYDWGYLANEDKILFGSAVLRESAYTGWLGKQFWYDKPTGKPTEKVCSDVLFALDKETGAEKWKRPDHLVMNPTITIADGTVYFVEIRDAKLKAGMERRIAAKEYKGKQYLVALDAETGAVRWERKLNADPGSVVCYLLHAEGILIYATSDEQYGLFAFDAKSGEKLWEQHHAWTGNNHSGHMQHPVVLAGTVYLEPRGYTLRTGELVTENVGRHGGCATYMAVENALIYRGPDRQTSMWDIENNKVTNWTRLRPSCWLSTIAGAGMVLAPEAGGGCSCGGWMETSVAFAPVVRGGD